jgi:signal peptidase I
MRVAVVGIGVTALVAGGALVWLRGRLLVVTVVGLSMEPTLRAGERLLARRGAAASGDIVVVRNPKGDPPLLVKRLVAAAGEELPAALGGGVVPEGRVAVLGDNPRHSLDSRHFGLLPAGHVVGIALRRIGGGAPDLR